MNIDDAFGSGRLNAEDLPARGVSVVIAEVKMESVGQGKEQKEKPCVYFEKTDKSLVLNKTNANRIAEVLGSRSTEAWIGKTIKLKKERVDFQGSLVDAIRVALEPKDSDDEIPF
jgi:hypothetical protein